MTVSTAVLVASAVVLVLIAAGQLKINNEGWPSRKARLLLVAIGLAVLLGADALFDSELLGLVAALMVIAVGAQIFLRRSASN